MGKEMSAIAKMTTKGQITVPLAVRDDMGLHAGDRVEFAKGADGKYVLVKKTRTLDELFEFLGKFKLDHKLTQDGIDDAITDHLREKHFGR